MSMTLKKFDVGVFGIQGWKGQSIQGYEVPTSDTRVPVVNPAYHFRKDTLRMIHYAWGREWSRPEHERRLGVLLNGPKGAGKTTVVEQFFARITVPVYAFTASRHTELLDLIESKTLVDGTILPVDGPLALAMRNGCPFILNEVNLMDPGTLTGLNDIIERGICSMSDGTTLRAKRGFVFFATSNDIASEEGVYGGTNVMNHAFLSRFVHVSVQYPDPKEEIAILMASIKGLLKATATKMVAAANSVRKSEGIAATLSTRELLTWGELMVHFRGLANVGEDPVAFALNAAIGNAIDAPSREALNQVIQRHFANGSASEVSTAD